MIHISCTGQSITLSADTPLVANTIGRVQFSLSLDAEWAGLTVDVVFSGSGVVKTVLYTGPADVPWEVLQSTGRLNICCVGRSGSVQYPTMQSKTASLPISQSGPISGEEPLPEPSPDVPHQALEIAMEAKEAAITAQDSAIHSAESAQSSAQQAAITAETVEQDKLASGKSAQAAQEAADSAQRSAQSAYQSAQDAAESLRQAVLAQNAAAGSANNAALSEQSAQSSAADAAEAKRLAVAASEASANSAAAALASQNDAAESKQASQAAANSAAESKNSAQEYAQSAKQSANQAIEAATSYNPDYYTGVDLTEKFAAEIGNTDVWTWMKQRISAADTDGYKDLHVADYIPVTCKNNAKLKCQIAGIDTYRRYGDQEVGHHIDFISKDLWPTRHVMNPVNWNNGLVPIETITGDGSTADFVLTKEMYGVKSVTVAGAATTEYTYDPDTFTISFLSAPDSGAAIVVTGMGSECPWLASDLYFWLNSKRGHVPGDTTKPPNTAVRAVDYTQDGVLYFLPDALQAAIAEKRIILPKRYNASNIVTSDTNLERNNIGKLWIPSEMEVYGTAVWGNSGYGTAGFIQYPIFRSKLGQVKGLGEVGGRAGWWLLSASAGITTSFALVNIGGYAGTSGASDTAIGAPVCFRIKEV